jgi:hypothetical protein
LKDVFEEVLLKESTLQVKLKKEKKEERLE